MLYAVGLRLTNDAEKAERLVCGAIADVIAQEEARPGAEAPLKPRLLTALRRLTVAIGRTPP